MEDNKGASRKMKTKITWSEYNLHVQLGAVQINKASVLKGK